MTLYRTVLWLYSLLASLAFGASIFESLVVHPAWSRKPPESLVGFMGAPINRLNMAAFWKLVAPLYALGSLCALAVAFRVGAQGTPLILSSACAVATVAWTLVYFRPTIERFLEIGGGNAGADRLQSEARRWILLNWVRLVVITVAWWAALSALAHG
jgi:Anthrone oxygenase